MPLSRIVLSVKDNSTTRRRQESPCHWIRDDSCWFVNRIDETPVLQAKQRHLLGGTYYSLSPTRGRDENLLADINVVGIDDAVVGR